MAMKGGDKPFTLIMDDPASNSYLQVTICSKLSVHPKNIRYIIRFLTHDNNEPLFISYLEPKSSKFRSKHEN